MPLNLCMVSSFPKNLVLMWMRSHNFLQHRSDSFHMCALSHKAAFSKSRRISQGIVTLISSNTKMDLLPVGGIVLYTGWWILDLSSGQEFVWKLAVVDKLNYCCSLTAFSYSCSSITVRVRCPEVSMHLWEQQVWSIVLIHLAWSFQAQHRACKQVTNNLVSFWQHNPLIVLFVSQGSRDNIIPNYMPYFPLFRNIWANSYL